jgi:hypothetical protein
MKMKVKGAAAQLSSSMTSTMETLTTLGVLPSDAIFTAEFVQKVDDLFDSLRVPITQRKYLFRNYTTNHTTPADRFTTGTTMQG